MGAKKWLMPGTAGPVDGAKFGHVESKVRGEKRGVKAWHRNKSQVASFPSIDMASVPTLACDHCCRNTTYKVVETTKFGALWQAWLEPSASSEVAKDALEATRNIQSSSQKVDRRGLKWKFLPFWKKHVNVIFEAAIFSSNPACLKNHSICSPKFRLGHGHSVNSKKTSFSNTSANGNCYFEAGFANCVYVMELLNISDTQVLLMRIHQSSQVFFGPCRFNVNLVYLRPTQSNRKWGEDWILQAQTTHKDKVFGARTNRKPMENRNHLDFLLPHLARDATGFYSLPLVS